MIVGLLLLANLALFAWMRWGGMLTQETNAPAQQTALNAEKVKQLEWLAASAVAPTANPTRVLTLTLSPVSAPVAAVAAESEPPMQCAEWGEFSGTDLKRVEQALAAMKLGERLTQRFVEQDHGFWVYIPPLNNRVAVEKKIEQLKARGVEDYFVVQGDGKWQNAISLGVFKTEEAAKKYLAALQTKTVRSAKVGERASKLRFTVFMLKQLDAATTDKLEALHKDFPDSSLKLSACAI